MAAGTPGGIPGCWTVPVNSPAGVTSRCHCRCHQPMSPRRGDTPTRILPVTTPGQDVAPSHPPESHGRWGQGTDPQGRGTSTGHTPGQPGPALGTLWAVTPLPGAVPCPCPHPSPPGAAQTREPRSQSRPKEELSSPRRNRDPPGHAGAAFIASSSSSSSSRAPSHKRRYRPRALEK